MPVEKDQKITINVTSEEEITSIVLTDPYGDDILTLSNIGKEYSNTEILPTINGRYKLVVTTVSGQVKNSVINVHSLYTIDMFMDLMLTDEWARVKWYEAETRNYKDIQEYIDVNFGEGLTVDDVVTMMGPQMKNNNPFAETEDYAEKVNTNGGFYIGRYEAGDSSATENRTSEKEGTLVTQKDKYVYNIISQTDALAKAKAYNTSLTSTLLTGAAWDRTLGWLYETGEKTGAEIVADSKDWGNYYDDTFSNTTGLIKTGEYEQTKAKNIYDLAGNVSEWTTESCNTAYRFGRGGCSNDNDEARYPASYGYDYDPSSANSRLGFRVALFM